MTNQFIKKIIYTLQQTFISLIPYLILRASCTLLIVFEKYLPFGDSAVLYSLINITYDLFPVLLCISLSYNFAKKEERQYSIGILLMSIFCFFIVSGYITEQNSEIVIERKHSIIYSIFIPIIVYCITQISKKYFSPLTISSRLSILNNAFSFVIPYVLIFFLTLLWHSLDFLNVSSWLESLFSGTSIQFQAVMHLLISHLLWSLGIHGTTTYRYTFDMDFYYQDIFQLLSYEQFFSAFIIFGGAGSTISLIIAIFLFSKRRHSRSIAKISAPFSIFNINETIIYGLPLALNKSLIIPFVLLPFINFFLSYLLISFDVFTFSQTKVPWTIPPVISGYLLTDSIWASLWQLLLISIGVLIYKPFLNRFEYSKYNPSFLASHLSLNKKFDDFDSDYEFYIRQNELNKKEDELKQLINHLTSGTLELYYQPIVNIHKQHIHCFEALLRHNKDGVIYPPDFLPKIQEFGLEEMIDQWTIKQVAEDYTKWGNEKYSAQISINIYPKTLLNEKNINFIIEHLSYKNICIEILEKDYTKDRAAISAAVERLKSVGINTSIDDFGSEYSNLAVISDINASTIKIDREILLGCDKERGFILFESIVSTFKKMGFKVILEGVETKEQLDVAKKANVDAVQGWLYTKALPILSVIDYARDFNNSNSSI